MRGCSWIWALKLTRWHKVGILGSQEIVCGLTLTCAAPSFSCKTTLFLPPLALSSRSLVTSAIHGFFLQYESIMTVCSGTLLQMIFCAVGFFME